MTAHAVMRGSSMEPLVHEGMLLEISSSARAPRVGDIVAFRAGERLVAHRVVRRHGRKIICSSDAQPDCIDVVAPEDFVGTVQAIYGRKAGRIQRVDTLKFRVQGYVLAYLQPLRSLFHRVAPSRRRRTYRALVRAASGILRGDRRLLLASIEGAMPLRLAMVAERHRMGALLCASLEPVKTNPYARALLMLLQRRRWANAAYMPRYRAQVLQVVRILSDAGIEAVLLKGAARAFALEPGWVFHDSSDIDVLVAPGDVARACDALRKAGYRERCSAADERRYVTRHHHAPPLYPPGSGVFVEVHRALYLTMLDRTTLGALRPYIVEKQNGDLRALVLDRVGKTLHYAIHTIDRPSLRDVMLLGQSIAAMSKEEREALHAALKAVRCEEREAYAGITLAARMAGVTWQADAATERFAQWMLQREDLPRPLRARPQCVDAWFSAHGSRVAAIARAAWEHQTVQSAAARAGAAAATALYLRLMPREDREAETLR